MSEDARRPRWALIALLAAIGLVVIIAVLAVLLRGEPTRYPADTPEGVVQRYSQAAVDGDIDTALTYVVQDVADSCEQNVISDDVRVTLVKASEQATSARVDVRMTTVYQSGPLGTSEYESEGAFRLVKSGDTWLIQSAPYDLAVCFELGQ